MKKLDAFGQCLKKKRFPSSILKLIVGWVTVTQPNSVVTTVASQCPVILTAVNCRCRTETFLYIEPIAFVNWQLKIKNLFLTKTYFEFSNGYTIGWLVLF